MTRRLFWDCQKNYKREQTALLGCHTGQMLTVTGSLVQDPEADRRGCASCILEPRPAGREGKWVSVSKPSIPGWSTEGRVGVREGP